MERPVLTTRQKASSINLDKRKYGTLAEIGAGRETARWFFRVGGADPREASVQMCRLMCLDLSGR